MIQPAAVRAQCILTRITLVACAAFARYVTALAQAVRPEYEAIAATGIQIQIDCPDLAMGRHTRYVDMSDAEFDAVAAANVTALNASLVNVPASRVRIHVCWGNYAGPHHRDLAAYSVWPHVANIHAKYLLFEGANPRHGHDVAAFEHAVSTGLIDTTVSSRHSN
jgi:5-methyltetrahydropteroyltriglutamate--homocysteine methyltransferase